ncbi:MAG: tRNA (adenosine(37)-N6)-dimethylallyltransferase MiaA [Planctomycetota bacterium]|nr:MAG: tRNA (adenosine(37)-N6)-dimethylallyltransferase MiaA [Planctomycetota bacterium]
MDFPYFYFRNRNLALATEEKIPILIILGPTASGKTSLSLELARLWQTEIIACDSMQVYRHMDIGTGKPSLKERKEIPHHVMDILEPWESFDVAQYIRHADEAAEKIWQKGRIPILTGGTPLYLKRFIEGIGKSPPSNPEIRHKWEEMARQHGVLFLSHKLSQIDPVATLKIHPHDKRRLVRALEVYELTGRPISHFWQEEGKEREKYDFYIVGLSWPREILYERINQRVHKMMEEGWWEEALKLPAMNPSKQASQALGYKEILEGIQKKYSLEKIIYEIQKRTRHYAKRQILWFQQFPKVHWLEVLKEGFHENLNWKKIAKSLSNNIREIWMK